MASGKSRWLTFGACLLLLHVCELHFGPGKVVRVSEVHIGSDLLPPLPISTLWSSKRLTAFRHLGSTKRYRRSCVCYSVAHTLVLLLVLSGDVELNPGPADSTRRVRKSIQLSFRGKYMGEC